MANLTAVFELVDRISDKLDSIANRGSSVVDSWENAGSVMDDAFGGAVSAASGAVTAVNGYSAAVGDAAEALNREADIMAKCDKAGQQLYDAIEATAAVQEDCSAAMEQANKVAQDVAESDNVSAKTEEALQEAIENATQAYAELEAAQSEAQAAMENFDAVLTSDTASLEDIEAAAQKAAEAADNLVSAHEKASNSTEELSKASSKASDEAGKGGVNAIQEVEAALASAGIINKVNDITESVYELATAFSDAESTVVMATGATGDALDDLTNSMMNAYAASKTGSLDDTAAAIGEINTRLAYTGDELTETTGLFLDFAAVTGGNAAKSVRSVTQLMNQWHVPAGDMEKMLSKLTYAGQASGISVDALSSQLTNNKAVLDQLGFSLDEATAMFMKFELAGTNASTVMTGFRTALSSGAVNSLDELYAVFDKISSGAMTAAEASEIFGKRAGPAIVSAVKDGVMSLDDMVKALENADDTLKTTAEAAQTLDQKWEQATNNINAAFTKAVEPALNSASSMLANAVNGIGKFLNENQLLTKILVAVGAGLGVVVTGIAAVTLVTKVVIPLITTLAGSLSAAQMAAMGLAGAAVAVVTFLAMASDSTAAFEEETQAIENLNAELDNLEARHNEITGSYNKTNSEIDAQYESSQKLINRLKELDAASEKTVGAEMEMKAVVDKLNEAYPQLGVTLGDVSNNLDDVIAKFEKAANADSRTAKYENAKARYAQLITETDALKKTYDDAFAEAMRANAEYSNFNMGDAWVEMWGGKSDRTKWFEDANAASDRAYKLYMDNMNAIKECQQIMEEYGSIVEGTSEEQIDAYDAVKIAIDKVKDASIELITKYNESYQSAYDSISGTIGLFDQMAISCETSTDQMIAALKSQSDYIAAYTENLKTAADIGLNEGLIAALSDGSDESAGYLDAIISKVEELGGTTDEAKKFIDEMNSSFSDVEKAKDEFATTVADMQTNFDEEMEKLSKSLEDTITKMNMDDEAAQAAKETLEAYVQMIESYKGKAGDAAAQVAEAASSALMIALWNDNGSNYPGKVAGQMWDASIPYGPQQLDLSNPPVVPAHAAGTTNAEDVFIAGEQGPELIVGAGGSAVFPHEDTESIINAVSEPQEQTVRVINEYEPTDFISKLKGAFSDIVEKISSSVDKVFSRNSSAPESFLSIPVEKSAYYESAYDNSKAFDYSTGDTISETHYQYENAYDNSRAMSYITGDAFDERTFSYDFSTTIDQSTGDTYNQRIAPVDNTDRSEALYVPTVSGSNESAGRHSNSDASPRKIVLEINGGGSIGISGGVSKETVLEWLSENLKPKLLEIIETEIMEEGEMVYDY